MKRSIFFLIILSSGTGFLSAQTIDEQLLTQFRKAHAEETRAAAALGRNVLIDFS